MIHSKRLSNYMATFIFIFLCLLITPQFSIADTTIYGANAYGFVDMVEINLTQEISHKVGTIAFETQAIDQDPETGYVYYFEWRATGNEFAYWDPATDTNTVVRTYYPVPGIEAKQMAFAPNGRLYLITNQDDLYSIDKDTGDLSWLGQVVGLETGPYGRTGDMAFSPDGRLYVFTYASLYIVDMDTLTATRLYADMLEGAGLMVWTGAAYCNGMLYASNAEQLTGLSAIFSVDPDSGEVDRLFYIQTLLNDLSSCPAGIPPVNQPPELDPIGAKTVEEGGSLEFTVTATDPDGDNLAYTAGNLPPGATFDPVTQLFNWTPDYGQSGVYPTVLFTVTDNGDPPLSDSEAITITVGDVNRPPVLDPIGNRNVNEGELLTFTVTATDPEGDTLNFSAGSLPPGATFDTASSVFSWTPDYGQTGVYPNVLFTVTDDGAPPASDSETITITVGDVNQPPVLDPIGTKSVNENETLTFTVTGNDADGDNLTFSASNLPSGAGFNPVRQEFSWTPAYGQEGSYPNVLFTVIDDGNPSMSDSEAITITVGDVNRPPVLDPIGDRSVAEGEALTFTVTASDPDGDNLTFSTGILPPGASFDSAGGVFSWTPDDGQTNDYTVLFTVTDDGSPAESDNEQITITVNTFSTPLTVTLSGENYTEDTMIVDGSYSLSNFGESPENLAVGSYGITSRALVKWDLSSIPTGSTILKAEMSLYSRQDYTGGPITINAYRILQPWVEGTLQGQDRQLDNPFSSCWLEYGYGDPWDEPGANGLNDKDPSILSSTTNSGIGWYLWDLTAAFQRWVDGDWTNNGLVLVSDNENNTNLKIFATSEYQDENFRPKLVIEYILP